MQAKETHKGVFRRIVMLFFVFLIVFQICPPPVLVAEAADAHTYYIQTAVDTSNWTIAAGVVNDKDALFGNYTEVERIGSNNLSNLKADSPSNMLTGMLSSMPSSGGGGDKNNKVLSFPGFDTGPLIGFTPQASTTMQDRAMFVKDSIVFDLNTAINVVYEGKKWNTLDEFRASVVSILSAAESGGTVNGWSFTRSFSKDATLQSKLTNEEQGVYPENYVMLSKGSEKYYLMTGIVKYLDSMSESDKPSNPADDTTYITWGTIFYEALVNSTLDKDAVTADTVYNSTVQGLLEGAVTDLFSALLNGIRSLLGLWDLDQLIFNRGSRGSTGFVAGIFPSSWESFIWTFFLVTEILSFAIIMMAIAKHIMQRAAATVNPAIRANLMEQIKDMAVGIILLILLPALIVGLMQISAALVNVFDSMVADKSITESLSHFSTGNSIAAIIVGFANLIINIYFNWFYIIREITVALLIVLSPIFITWMCMGSEKKGMAMRWLMELMSNIFIQPIHALLFAFILLLPSTGRPIESLVMLYCLIPLTALLKGLFFPGVSDMGNRIAGAAGARANAMAKKTGMAAIGAGIGAAKGGFDYARARREANKSSSSSSNAGESSSGDNNIKQKHVNEGSGESTKEPARDKTKREVLDGAGSVATGNTQGQQDHAKEGEEVDTSQSQTGSPAAAKTGTQTDSKIESKGNPGTDGSPKGMQSITNKGSVNDDLPDGEGGPVTMEENGKQEGSNIPQKVENDGENLETNPNVKPREKLEAFSNDLKENMRAASIETANASAHKLRRAEGPSTAGAAARMIAGAAVTGAVRGWKGQVFADHANNRMTRNAHADYLNASKEKAERAQQAAEAQRAEDIRQGKQDGQIPSIPYRQVGDDYMTKKDDAAANGFENVQRFKDGDGNWMSYDVAAEDLSAHDRDSLAQIADNPEMKAMAAEAGYKVDRIRNSDGTDTGQFHVKVGDNHMTGVKAPELQGNNIVHGGANHNNLVPDADSIRDTAKDVQAYQAFNTAFNDRQDQINDIRDNLTAQGNEEVRMINDRESIGLRSVNYAEQAQDTKRATPPVAIAAGIGGPKSVSGSGPKATASFTQQQAEDQGLRNLRVNNDTGEVSYDFIPEDAKNGHLQVMAQKLESGDTAQVIADYGKRGFEITPTQVQNDAGELKNGYTVTVKPTKEDAPVLTEQVSTGGTRSYVANQKSTPIVPTIEAGEESAAAVIRTRAETARSEVSESINQTFTAEVNKLNTNIPEITPEALRGEQLYAQKMNRTGGGQVIENVAPVPQETPAPRPQVQRAAEHPMETPPEEEYPEERSFISSPAGARSGSDSSWSGFNSGGRTRTTQGRQRRPSKYIPLEGRQLNDAGPITLDGGSRRNGRGGRNGYDDYSRRREREFFEGFGSH